MEHLFIVNPAAGKGAALSMAEHIRHRFEGTSLNWRILKTWGPGHATILAREAVANQPDIHIYSVGGDGTLNEVVNGLAETESPLGILPCGSGNDSIRSLTDVHDPVLLLESLVDARIEKTDLGKLNDRWFLNIASAGFDAEVVNRTNHFKKLPLVPGSLAYVMGVLTTLIQRNLHEVTITLDDGEPEKSILLLAAFANGKYYGGGMQPTPAADLHDGLLNSCRVSPLSRMRMLKFFPKFIKGQHGIMEEVRFDTFKRLLLESEQPLPINIDGELSTEKRVEVTIHPGALRLKHP